MKQAAFNPDLSKFLVIGALLFIIGVAGVLTRRNIIVIFMSIELILNAANLNFIAFSRYLHGNGQPQRARRPDIHGVCDRGRGGRSSDWFGNRYRALQEQGNDLGRRD